MPTPMLWSSVQLTDTLSIEAVWLTTWEETRIDPRGSFFSTNDTVSDDGDKVVLTFGRRNDDNSVTTYPSAIPGVAPGDPAAMVWLPREADRKPDDESNQHGVALRYYADMIGAEFGAYYLNYHSRTPIVSLVKGGSADAGGATTPGAGVTSAINAPGGLAPSPRCSDEASANCRASYYAEYPQGIELYGLSFNMGGPYGTAIQGEYSYRPNQPLQLPGQELVMAALGLTNTVTGQGFIDHDASAATPALPAAFLTVAPGTEIKGYERVEMHQVQATVTKAFGPMFGASQSVALGDFGATQLDIPDGVVLSAPGAALPNPGSGRGTDAQPSGSAAGGSVQTEGFLDEFSWGYRLVGRLDYENVIGSVGVSPRLVWSHDVNGAGPTFNEGTKAVSVGVGFNYLQRWQGDIVYTSFFGGRSYSGTDAFGFPATQDASYEATANPNVDRDFLAVSISYAF